jgi:hypothetical protein
VPAAQPDDLYDVMADYALAGGEIIVGVNGKGSFLKKGGGRIVSRPLAGFLPE